MPATLPRGPSLFLDRFPTQHLPSFEVLTVTGISGFKPVAQSVGGLLDSPGAEHFPAAAVDHFPADTFLEAVGDLDLPDPPVFDIFGLV